MLPVSLPAGISLLKKKHKSIEVAARYGVCEDSVWSWIRSGKLKALKIGRNYRIRREDLEEFEKSK